MRTALAVAVTVALFAATLWLILARRSTTPSRPPALNAVAILSGADLRASSFEIGVAEPSGVVYHATLDRLYVVGDDGHIAELDPYGRRLRVTALKGDLEDVTVHTPTGHLLLVSERKPRLIRFDPRAFLEIARWHLDRPALLGASPGKKHKGFEGIAFRPEPGALGGGLLSLAHQRRPAAVVHLAFDLDSTQGATINDDAIQARWTYARRRALNALTYSSKLRRYLAVDGHTRRLLVLGQAGEIDAELALPGAQPEGVCLDARGNLWIADDQRGLWRCPGALAALAAHLNVRLARGACAPCAGNRHGLFTFP